MSEVPEDPCNLLTVERNILTTLTQVCFWGPIIYYAQKNKLYKPILEAVGVKKPKNATNKRSGPSKRKSPKNARNGRMEIGAKEDPNEYELTIVDKCIGALLCFFMISNIFTRFTRGVPHWMVQPCHLLTMLLIYLVYSKKNSADLFTFYLYCNWMPFLGLAFYDASWYVYFYELPMFHLQHVLMIIIPWYYVFTKRFQVTHNPNRKYIYLQAVGSAMMYHAVVLVWTSHFANEDFSGMKCRFPGGEFTGLFWREFQIVLGCILSILFGIIPEIIILALFSSKQNMKIRSA